jgi:hypothetical protein
MWAKRQDWWMEYPPMCKNGPGRSLLITTPKVSRSTPPLGFSITDILPVFQALQSDFDAVLQADKMNPTSLPMKQASFDQNSPKTLYGHEFLITMIDEAHFCRTHNKAYFASFGIMERSKCKVAMTATPVISRPQVSLVLPISTPFDTSSSSLAGHLDPGRTATHRFFYLTPRQPGISNDGV